MRETLFIAGSSSTIALFVKIMKAIPTLKLVSLIGFRSDRVGLKTVIRCTECFINL